MSKTFRLSLPELIFVAATRGMIGVGVGLMLANKLTRERRVQIGLPLFIAGALSTIPIARHVFGDKGNPR